MGGPACERLASGGVERTKALACEAIDGRKRTARGQMLSIRAQRKNRVFCGRVPICIHVAVCQVNGCKSCPGDGSKRKKAATDDQALIGDGQGVDSSVRIGIPVKGASSSLIKSREISSADARRRIYDARQNF